MIDFAQQKYTGIEFYNRDVLKTVNVDKYDIVVFSGTFILRKILHDYEWENYAYAIINKMWEMTNIDISFKLLIIYSIFKGNDLFYLNPSDMFKYCLKNFSQFVNMHQ